MSILLSGATVWAGERPRPVAGGWLLVEGGRIGSVGTGAPPEAEHTIELRGHHVLPGFTDAHSHLTAAAWLATVGDGSSWRSAGDALAAVRRAAAVGRGWVVFARVDEHDWQEPVLPTLDELDAAGRGRPVLLAHLSLHKGVVSTAGLAAIATGRTAIGRPDPDLDRDRRGRPTGVVWEHGLGRALFEVARWLEVDHDPVARFVDEAARHLAYGITRVHDPGVPATTAVQLEAAAARTPLRIGWAGVAPTGMLDPVWPGDDGDGPVPTQVKAFLDGAERCAITVPARALPRMAAGPLGAAVRRRSLAPLREATSRPLTLRERQLVLDLRQWRDVELRTWLEGHLAAGRRVRLHALGNLAVRQATAALLDVRAPRGSATIEHAMFLAPREVDAIATAGATASLQPGFLPHYARQIADAGVPGHLLVKPLRSLQAAGADLAISSDHPCGPLDPLHNLRRAVDRSTGQTRLQPREAVDAVTAVAAATAGGARAAGTPVEEATIVSGAPADLAICDGDPFAPRTRVVQTWVGGEVVHRVDGAARPRGVARAGR
jgi:predicted amidohydrolase YtcJ